MIGLFPRPIKGGFQYAIKACIAHPLGGRGAGGMLPPPKENLGDCFSCNLGVKLQKLDDLVLNLARRIKDALGPRGCKAPGYPIRCREITLILIAYRHP